MSPSFLHKVFQHDLIFSGLFHRVILMSGSLFSPWSRVRDPLSYALQLAERFNCTAASRDALIAGQFETDPVTECLRDVPANRLLQAGTRVPSFHLAFGPSFDGVTVKDNFADIKGKRSFGTRYGSSFA